jgi:hypothetical protein
MGGVKGCDSMGDRRDNLISMLISASICIIGMILAS